MKKYLVILKDVWTLTAATAIVAAAVFFFLIPSRTSVGSISGLAIVLSGLIPLPVSILTMVLNVVLLILGFLFIGKEFGGKTVYTSILLPVFIGVLEIVFPGQQSLTADPFLDVLCYIGAVSVGLAMLFNANASSGGLDIVAKFLNKYLRMDLGTAMSVSGICVALSSALVNDSKSVILSILGTLLNGVVLDYFILGMNLKKRVCIVSDRSEQIRRYIIRELHSGATIYQAVGAYDRTPREEIITIVDRQEYGRLMNYIAQNDPKAFVTVYNVNKIIYRPKNQPLRDEST